jgi:NADH:ubiquinone oxidoreductase subunit
MHYSSDTPPTEQKAKPHKWQQEHQPNLTGTSGAYLPPGHIAKGADRAHNAADYQPWKPK